MREITNRKKNKKKIAAVFFFIVLVMSLAIVFGLFRVRKLVIKGNSYYSAQKIQESIMQDGLCKNSLYLMWKLNDPDKVKESLPFLNGARAEMIKPYEIRVTVQEKPQIGYFLNQGSYVYFDKDGMVVEVSGEVREDVPLITGLDVEKAELYEKLPVTDEGLYNTIVTLTKTLNKNGIVPQEIRFGTRNTITLIFDSVKVKLGDDSALEDKISALDSILDQLEGKSGTLYMESYTENDGTVTFKSDGEDIVNLEGDSGEDETNPEEADGGGDGEEKNGQSTQAETQPQGGRMYSESDGTFSTDEQGNKIYTDAAGVTTTQCDHYNYTDENGNIIMDGYGYIDPYTGSYIN